MTQSTYTIAHIKVGAKKYWEEVGGFVSGDKKELILENIKDKIAFLKELNTAFQSKLYIPWKADEEYFNDIFKQNPSHPLSELANRLGATIYGGFEDEKDFYLMMPTILSEKFGILKVGDLSIFDSKEWGGDKDNKHYFYFDGNCFQWSGGSSRLESDDDWRELGGNIFQEYARTGIIENDLCKQFFK